MADWRVSKEIVKVKEHPNADTLEILKVGDYQMVSGKGNYNTGDVVVIIPEKSVIPPGPIYDEYEKYLTGPDKNRVKGIRLRGEMSEAITWPIHNLGLLGSVNEDGSVNGVCKNYEAYQNASAAAIGEDISSFLGITKYEAPVPYNMKGEVESFDGAARHHDVYQYASYADEIQGDVIVTEKLHGSQINYFLDVDGTESVSSKGLLKRGLRIKEDEKNVYWQAARNCDLTSLAHELMYLHNPTKRIQLIGEVIPVQKGFSYDQTEKVVKLFDVVVDGESVPFENLDKDTLNLWVPVYHLGDISGVDVQKYSKGKEQVSGKELHIKEGIVVKSLDKEKSEDGKRLIVKVLNPKYKDEDSFN